MKGLGRGARQHSALRLNFVLTARAASIVASIINLRLSSMSMAIECIVACEGPLSASEGCGATARICRRHVGQRPSLFSHSFTHDWWNLWLQMSVVVGMPFSPRSPRHITHSPTVESSAKSSTAGVIGVDTTVMLISDADAAAASATTVAEAAVVLSPPGRASIGCATTTSTPSIVAGVSLVC